MIRLQEIDQSNFNECMGLERKVQRFVGNAAYVLAEAYTFRHYSTTYGIYNDKIMIGLVTLRSKPIKQGGTYDFTNMFIADNYQGKGFGCATVEVILKKFKDEGGSDTVKLCVHEDNDIALHIYKKFGFIEVKRSDWDNSFIELSLKLH